MRFWVVFFRLIPILTPENRIQLAVEIVMGNRRAGKPAVKNMAEHFHLG